MSETPTNAQIVQSWQSRLEKQPDAAVFHMSRASLELLVQAALEGVPAGEVLGTETAVKADHDAARANLAQISKQPAPIPEGSLRDETVDADGNPGKVDFSMDRDLQRDRGTPAQRDAVRELDI